MEKLLVQIPGRNIFQGIAVSNQIFLPLKSVSPVTRP